jgi:hypothetical protein
MRVYMILITILLIFSTAMAQTPAPPRPVRSLKVCVAADAPEEIRKSADDVLAAVKTDPLLVIMYGSNLSREITDTKALIADKPEARAYDHLILVGLPTDPMITAAWQREARTIEGGLYIFGYGYLKGDIGYVESDRNPFLHGAAIKVAPFETQVITITGSTSAGVKLATDAFLKQHMVNGVVAAAGWTRPQANLLQRDPLAPDFTTPDWIPAQIGEYKNIGVTMASEDEYRGVLADIGTEPIAIWRVKYLKPGLWDGSGAAKALDHYVAGLHRRAYANTLWCAKFESVQKAAEFAPKIAGAAKLKKTGTRWEGNQPSYGYSDPNCNMSLWQHDEWIVMSTLPDDVTKDIAK